MKRELKHYLNQQRDALIQSPQNLQAIFTNMFSGTELVMCEYNDGFRVHRLTYGQMREKACSVAAGLYDTIGATHGYVALEMDNSPDWIAAFWGILMSGNKPYLVNLRYPAALSNNILKTLEIRYTLCDRETVLDAEAIPFASLRGGSAVPEEVFEDTIAISSSATSMNEVICFYSGQQISKQILNFEGIVKEGPRIAKHYKGSIKQLAFLPFYHIFGLFAVFFWFAYFGRTFVFLRDYSPDTILKTCRRHNVTHIFAVPVLWHTIEKKVLAAAQEQGQKRYRKLQKGIRLMTKVQNLFPSLGSKLAKWVMRDVTDKLFGRSVLFCINGGSYLRNSAMELFNGIGYCMHNGYGMTEIGITSVELRSKPKYRNLNSVGHSFASVEYRLNENGVLLVKGSSLCTRKLVNGEPVQIDGWFDTGDNMELRDGHYYILGRQSDLVIGENGENINPDTVEQLFRIDSAAALSVLGLGENEEQALSLVVQLSPYASDETIAQIKEAAYQINETLPKSSAVSRFYFTTDPLMSANAIKVSRKQLARQIRQEQVRLTPFGELATLHSDSSGESPLLQQVRAIVAQALSVTVEQVSADSHIFYDLGGSSIQYFEILTKLAEHFDIHQYDKNESTRYTPRQIAEYLERHL